MGKLANISGKEAVKAFAEAGWILTGQVGSHCVMTKQGEWANHSFLSIKSFRLARCEH